METPSRLWREEVVRAALEGLTATKTLPPWLFYDNEGCRLFYEITRLPEYYLTRTEEQILSSRAADMVPSSVQGAALIEFGASMEHKARHLLDLDDPNGRPLFRRYVPVDVAQTELLQMQERLRQSHPALAVTPIVADFMKPLDLPVIDAPASASFQDPPLEILILMQPCSFWRVFIWRWGLTPGCCWALTCARTRTCCCRPTTMLPA